MGDDRTDPETPPKPDPFRLEPEAPEIRRVVLPSADTPKTRTAFGGPPTRAKVVGKDGEERVVSTQTLKERKDPGSRARPGPVPLPPGWPREALTFPFRGRKAFATALAVAVAVDVVGALQSGVGWILWVACVPLVARWQVRTVARTATGDDVAPTLVGAPPEGAAVESAARQDARLADAALTFLLFGLYLAPAAVPFLAPYLRDPSHPVRTGGETAALVAFLAVALVVIAPAFLLAAAFDDRELRKPWVALRWFARGPLAFLAVAASWGVVLGAQTLVPRAWPSVPTTLLVSVALRVACVHALLVAARVLGVLGRRYEP